MRSSDMRQPSGMYYPVDIFESRADRVSIQEVGYKKLLDARIEALCGATSDCAYAETRAHHVIAKVPADEAGGATDENSLRHAGLLRRHRIVDKSIVVGEHDVGSVVPLGHRARPRAHCRKILAIAADGVERLQKRRPVSRSDDPAQLVLLDHQCQLAVVVGDRQYRLAGRENVVHAAGDGNSRHAGDE